MELPQNIKELLQDLPASTVAELAVYILDLINDNERLQRELRHFTNSLPGQWKRLAEDAVKENEEVRSYTGLGYCNVHGIFRLDANDGRCPYHMEEGE